MDDPCFVEVKNASTNVKEEKPYFEFWERFSLFVKLFLDSIFKCVVAFLQFNAKLFVLVNVNINTFCDVSMI